MTLSSGIQHEFDTQAISTLQTKADGSDAAQGERILYSIGRRSMVQPPIRPYDFKRPERISQDQLRSLKSLHESFARNYGGQLTGMSRMIVDMEIEAAEQISYAEYIGSIGNPTCFATVLAPELGGRLLLEPGCLLPAHRASTGWRCQWADRPEQGLDIHRDKAGQIRASSGHATTS